MSGPSSWQDVPRRPPSSNQSFSTDFNAPSLSQQRNAVNFRQSQPLQLLRREKSNNQNNKPSQPSSYKSEAQRHEEYEAVRALIFNESSEEMATNNNSNGRREQEEEGVTRNSISPLPTNSQQQQQQQPRQQQPRQQQPRQQQPRQDLDIVVGSSYSASTSTNNSTSSFASSSSPNGQQQVDATQNELRSKNRRRMTKPRGPPARGSEYCRQSVPVRSQLWQPQNSSPSTSYMDGGGFAVPPPQQQHQQQHFQSHPLGPGGNGTSYYQPPPRLQQYQRGGGGYDPAFDRNLNARSSVMYPLDDPAAVEAEARLHRLVYGDSGMQDVNGSGGGRQPVAPQEAGRTAPFDPQRYAEDFPSLGT